MRGGDSPNGQAERASAKAYAALRHERRTLREVVGGRPRSSAAAAAAAAEASSRRGIFHARRPMPPRGQRVKPCVNSRGAPSTSSLALRALLPNDDASRARLNFGLGVESRLRRQRPSLLPPCREQSQRWFSHLAVRSFPSLEGWPQSITNESLPGHFHAFQQRNHRTSSQAHLAKSLALQVSE